MTLILNYEKLFVPYTEHGHTWEATLKYLQKVAAQRHIPSEIMELAITEIFSEIADGRKFNKEKCSCGCGIDKAATDLIHAIRDRMLEIDKEKTVLYKELLQRRYKTVIGYQMSRINKADKEFVKLMNPKAHRKDAVIGFFKRMFFIES